MMIYERMIEMKKYFAVSVVLLLAIASIIAYYYKPSKTSSEQKEIKTATALKEDLKVSISSEGFVNIPVYNLNFKSSGILSEVYVKEGDWVKKGQILAKLDSKNLEFQLEQAKSNYYAAIARYNKTISGASNVDIITKQIAVDNAKNALAIQEQIYNYKLSLFNEGKLSESELLLEKSKLESAKAQLATAQAQLEASKYIDPNDVAASKESLNLAKAQYEIAKNNLNESKLVSPIDGKILAINSKPGEFINSSNSQNPFIIIGLNNNVIVESNLLEDEINKIKVGQEVNLSFNAILNQTFVGKVVSISSIPQKDSSGIVSYKVFIQVSNPTIEIKQGMTAEVEFISKQVKDVIAIPNSAVKRINGKTIVEVLNSDGSIITKEIKVGFTDGTKVEVKEGLNQGEKVILSR